MKILRALGLGLVILILQFLIPRTFVAMEDALVALFHTAETAFEATDEAIEQTGFSLTQHSQ